MFIYKHYTYIITQTQYNNIWIYIKIIHYVILDLFKQNLSSLGVRLDRVISIQF